MPQQLLSDNGVAFNQSLIIGATYLNPAHAWKAGEYRGSDDTPIDIVVLEAAAMNSKNRGIALDAAASGFGNRIRRGN